MDLKPALQRIPARLSQPVFWGPSLALLIASGVPLFLVPDLAALPLWAKILWLGTNLLGIPLLLTLPPLAWQWGAADGRLTRPLRGVAQAFALEALRAGLIWILGIPIPLRPTPVSLFLKILLWAILFSGILCLGYTVARRELLRDLGARAEATARQAWAAQLRAQLSPHALLNTLNGLAGLMREDPPRAVQGMQHLAEVYRQLLELGNRPRIRLGEERAFLIHYLAVESLRLENLLRIEWDWDPAMDGHWALPLLVQPLVENAIKHGIAPALEGGTLRIEGRIIEQALRIQVSNNGLPPGPLSEGDGVGLANIRARLVLNYGKRASFHLDREQDWTCATLVIPLEV